MDFLRTQSFVDRERIGAIGVCGSGSFVISAAKIDPRIKAVATVSMYDMGAANRNGLRRSVTLEQRKELLERQRGSATWSSRGGETEYTSGTPEELTDSSHRDSSRVLRLLPHARGAITPEHRRRIPR